MSRNIVYDGITITALHLVPNGDGTWQCIADYVWVSSATPSDVRPRGSKPIVLTAGQQTTVQTFAAAKLADLKTLDGI